MLLKKINCQVYSILLAVVDSAMSGNGLLKGFVWDILIFWFFCIELLVEVSKLKNNIKKDDFPFRNAVFP